MTDGHMHRMAIKYVDVLRAYTLITTCNTMLQASKYIYIYIYMYLQFSWEQVFINMANTSSNQSLITIAQLFDFAC